MRSSGCTLKSGGSRWSLDAVPWPAWALMASNLFWVLAYDTEYAMVDRDDDLKIGIRTSALTLGRHDVMAVMGFYAAYLLSWAWLGRALGLGRIYLLGIAAAALQPLWLSTSAGDDQVLLLGREQLP